MDYRGMVKQTSLTCLLGMALLLPMSLAQAESVSGSAKADSMNSCVEETPFMRRNHMELIKHQRDMAVHKGIRDSKHSLSGCIECHAGKDQGGNFVPVNHGQEFCASCHRYTATSLDCFQCHSAVPR